jgi:hypothetical protein
MRPKVRPLAGWLVVACTCLFMASLVSAQPAKTEQQTLAVEGRSSATPSLAAYGEFVAVAWGASLPNGPTDIFLSMSRDGGKTFGAPIRVNDKEGDARVNGEQPPRVVLQRANPPIVTVVWTTKGAKGTRLVYARSDNGGRSFSPAATVPGGDAAGNRGWQTAAVLRRAKASSSATASAERQDVSVVWLDHRELVRQESMATAHHQHSGGKPDGVAMAQKSKLYLASLDGTIAPQAVTGGVCYCCKTAVVAGGDGSIHVAWRHVYPGNIRDIAFTVSRDGGRSFAAPVRVSEDSWELEGCPDDGPAMAIDNVSRIHVVWPTLVTNRTASGEEPEKALFYATSVDGRTFTARQRIPTEGTANHPQIAAAADGSMTIAWDEVVNGKRRAVMSRAAADPAGTARFERRVISGDEAALYPVLATTPHATIAAWTSGAGASSTIRVTRLVVNATPGGNR